ncbi:hypothetical protein BCR41DRAFT_345567 [Lobosporangium transversale]|uniref:Uncharacterized protein n=1 Tax=Lobosporangium transversale TaxID=64571 RepID=A0A1Y2GZ90_9FUNG|nr:hypothetical protein BCR41DRAFT_345567 [Lobosporangium transversale]ORZ27595.1 hypothetical protein BCR41DRAFT_345567 [Lobosporangium transversale]|eukprot:XP_021885298.1 hypothetical protein BCR41DRAFT_345567 [Lobosporangium transversale]
MLLTLQSYFFFLLMFLVNSVSLLSFFSIFVFIIFLRYGCRMLWWHLHCIYPIFHFSFNHLKPSWGPWINVHNTQHFERKDHPLPIYLFLLCIYSVISFIYSVLLSIFAVRLCVYYCIAHLIDTIIQHSKQGTFLT